MEECLILSNPKKYHDRASLWKAQDWDTALTLKATKHKSRPYHDGCSTLARLMFSHVGIGAQEANIPTFRAKRNLVSPLDEMVFYWTKIATPELINQTNEQSSNAAYYLLKHVAQHWVNQLELVNTTIAKGEWLSDDYQAKIDDGLSSKKWKAELIKVNEISKDINYMRRHLNHFWRSMVLNLERLGVQLGAEGIDNNTSLALQGAQKDFLTIHARMQPLRDRAEALVSVSNDLANLRAAFRGVQDSEFGLRLSLFASTIFPLTLVASIFSMSSDYQPGKPHFWKLWAIGPPFCIAIALGMIYGTRPWMVFFDIGEVLTTMAAWLTHHDLTTVKDGTAGYKQKSEAEKTPVMKKDEEHG
jgi:Mg2+ and Co2+ transporter CorA